MHLNCCIVVAVLGFAAPSVALPAARPRQARAKGWPQLSGPLGLGPWGANNKKGCNGPAESNSTQPVLETLLWYLNKTGPDSAMSPCVQDEHAKCFANVVEWSSEDGKFKCRDRGNVVAPKPHTCFLGGLKEYCNSQAGFVFLDASAMDTAVPHARTADAPTWVLECRQDGRLHAPSIPACVRVAWGQESDSRFALHSNSRDNSIESVVEVLFGSVTKVTSVVVQQAGADGADGADASTAAGAQNDRHIAPIKFADHTEDPVFHGVVGATRVAKLASQYYTQRLQMVPAGQSYTPEVLAIKVTLSAPDASYKPGGGNGNGGGGGTATPDSQPPKTQPPNGGPLGGKGMGRRAVRTRRDLSPKECKAYFDGLLAHPPQNQSEAHGRFQLPFTVYRPLISSAHSIQIVRGVAFDIPLTSILELVKGGSDDTIFEREDDDDAGLDWVRMENSTGEVSGVTPANWTSTVHLSLNMVDKATSSFSALPPISLHVQEPLRPSFRHPTAGLQVTTSCATVYPQHRCRRAAAGDAGEAGKAGGAADDEAAGAGDGGAAGTPAQLQSLFYVYRRGDGDDGALEHRAPAAAAPTTAAAAKGASVKFLKGEERYPAGATDKTVAVDPSTGEIKVTGSPPPGLSAPAGEYTVQVLMQEQTQVYTETVPVGTVSFTVTNMTRGEPSMRGLGPPPKAPFSTGRIGALVVGLCCAALLNVMWWRRQHRHGPPSFKFPDSDLWDFDRAMLTLGDEIGKGAFGVVYAGTALNIRGLPGPTQVAVKHCAPDASDAEKIDFVREAEQMKLFKHRNVIRLLGVCMQDEPLSIIAEFMALGDMKEYLRANHHTPLQTLLKLAFDVSAGLAYLSRIHVVHRDLAARNCLLDASMNAKIADFGMTRELVFKDYYTVNKHNMLPVRWMPVEALQTGRFTPASDVWSLGVVFWEIACHCEMPYPAMGNSDVYEYVLAGHRLKQPPGCPDFLYDVMCCCWLADESSRPTADAVLYQLAENMGVDVPADETNSMRTASLTSASGGLLDNSGAFMQGGSSSLRSKSFGQRASLLSVASARSSRSSSPDSFGAPLLGPAGGGCFEAAGEGYAQVTFGVAGADGAGGGGGGAPAAVDNAGDDASVGSHTLDTETSSVGRSTPRPSCEFAQDSNFLSYASNFQSDSRGAAAATTNAPAQRLSPAAQHESPDSLAPAPAPAVKNAPMQKREAASATVDVQQNLYFALPAATADFASALQQEGAGQVYVPLQVHAPPSSQALYAPLPAAGGENPGAVLLLPKVKRSMDGRQANSV